ncbi:MAG: tyrosine-type recombinase/integrase [Nocardioidaceae bacterium]|nr:tyrosine-type recombinase/integrase [Nocardioidaceae bacterium]
MIETTWHDPIRRWEAAQRAANLSPTTLRLYLHYLHHLARVCPDPWTVTSDDLAAFVDRDGWAPQSRKSARTSVRHFYRWAVRTGRLSSSPADALDAVRVPDGYARPAPDGALRDALTAADDRTALMLMLAALAGLRAMEVAAVHTRDVEPDRLVVRSGKGGKVRTVPLHPVLGEALEAELARRRAGRVGTGWRYAEWVTADGWLFPGQRGGHLSAGDVTRKLSRALGEDWTAHTLRHRLATAAYAGTRDLRAVQELMGHSKPETTARYTAVPQDAKRAAVAAVGL